ncbi:hypothetical protein [Mesorhizobium sp.]|uniref:hypothetical protein n=1 Tax=Mesorhizobium sp. TaxID=1871066 RepID=UPI0025F60195|nr:hypothetical protein [Mesorhizobium sp.]
MPKSASIIEAETGFRKLCHSLHRWKSGHGGQGGALAAMKASSNPLHMRRQLIRHCAPAVEKAHLLMASQKLLRSGLVAGKV